MNTYNHVPVVCFFHEPSLQTFTVRRFTAFGASPQARGPDSREYLYRQVELLLDRRGRIPAYPASSACDAHIRVLWNSCSGRNLAGALSYNDEVRSRQV